MSNNAQLQPRKLWDPPDPKTTLAYKFMQKVNAKRKTKLKTWEDLHRWSVDHRAFFWGDLLEEHPLIRSGSYTQVVDETARMDSVPRWFQGLEINFAENMLFWPDARDHSKATKYRKEDDKIACTEVREGSVEKRHCTWGELRNKVGLLSNALRARGVGKGDRCAIVASNSIDTLVVLLAITALGGIFTSSSTDMGTRGILDRLRQTKPKYIFIDDVAVYNGKTTDLRAKMKEIESGMSGIKELQGIVSMPRWQDKPRDIKEVPRCEKLADFLESSNGNTIIRFTRVGFNDPCLIVYSSGTTGMPKCIIHAAGAVLISAKKEDNLHRDAALHTDVVRLQYTTTGWIMYLSCAVALISGARTILYDGSPFVPDPKAFIKLWAEEKVTDLGLSPRYFQNLAMAKPPISPRVVADLSNLRRVVSTGMVLSEAQFEWFYDVGFPPKVQLANISGGTDLAACLTMDCTMKPIYSGGTMTPALGMKVEVYDSSIEDGKGVKGRAVPLGEQGELVCTLGFPTQPTGFWDDPSSERYFNSYYARFDNVWAHGDFVSVHPQNGQVYLYGRADGVLNPSGVRFGSAEIYNVIDHNFSDEVHDSICVGQRRQQDMDESVMLFLLMKPGKKFRPELVRKIREAIARDCGKRCVPRYIFETPEIPTTINLKKVELPVKQIVSGKKIKPSDTLANKECLDFYYQFAEVEKLAEPRSKL